MIIDAIHRSTRAFMLASAVSLLLVVVAGPAPLVAATSAPGSTPGPSLGPAQRWGWVVVRDPSHSYTPAALDQGNSSGGVDTVTHIGTGSYQVTFPGINTEGGVFNASALGKNPGFCDVGGWASADPNELVNVSCYSRTGVQHDSKFVLTYLAASGINGVLGYAWAEQATNPSYVPLSNFRYLSGPGAILAGKVSTGVYQLTFEGLLPSNAIKRGTVLVNHAAGGVTAVCNTAGWSTVDTATAKVLVRCRDALGNLVDNYFNVTFMRGLGQKGFGGTQVAYLQARKPKAASYTPDGAYTYSSAGMAPHVTRSMRGHYLVTLPGMPKGGAAIVTAVGTGAVRCAIGAIRTNGTPQKVNVICSNFAGHPADSKFDLSYMR